MAVGYYECHITMLGNVEKIEEIVKQTTWHYSKIDGDPILGLGVKSYATKNFKKDEISVKECMDNMRETMKFIINNNIKVIRIKIEDIIYDERF